jgi:hypothetical protein
MGIPYAEETIREAVSLLTEEAAIEGDGPWGRRYLQDKRHKIHKHLQLDDSNRERRRYENGTVD